MEKWRLASDGVLECVNTETGEVLIREKKRERKISKITGKPVGRPVKGEQDSHHWMVGEKGQKYWVPKGTNADTLPRTVYPFSQTTADEICRQVAEGRSLSYIGKQDGYPPSYQIQLWARRFPEFKAELKLAKESQAEVLADKIMDMVNGGDIDEDLVPGKRLIFDALKFLTAVRNPNEYGPKTKIVGDAEQPISFVIHTGINREEEPKEVEAKVES